MAETLPSPPASRSTSPKIEQSDALVERLDGLLEQYLELLDQYTKHREELSNSLSSGFLSLAHAQRVSNLGPGRRYGSDFYDERMKAQRRTMIHQPENRKSMMTVEKCIPSKQHPISCEQRPTENESKGLDKSSDDDGTSGSIKETPPGSDKPKARIDPADRDPTKWFGFSTPPPLRQCQLSFISIVEHSAPDLLRLDSEMKDLESKIWEARDELDIIHEYRANPELYTTSEPESDKPTEEQVASSTSLSKQRHAFRPLSSHPTHSTSSLLKLGD